MSVSTTSVEQIRKSVVSFGESQPELVLSNLPADLSYVPELIRRTYNSYSRHKIDAELIEDYIRELDHLSRIESFVYYIMAYYVIMATLKRVRSLELAKFLSENYARVEFFESPTDRSNADKLAELVSREFGEGPERLRRSLRYLSGGIRRVIARRKIHHFIAVQRRLQNFEKYAREFFVPYALGERGTKSARALVRAFIHRTNAPISIAIASSDEYKRYVPVVDMYTALVTIRSGSFEDIGGERVKRLLARMAMCRSSGHALRVEHVRGVVRAVARASEDPILYERGAFYIGYRYCGSLNCEACPIRDICRRYTWVKIK